MKANEAPEKIYLRHNHKGDIGAGWLIFPLTNNDIEYIRTDAFIEKARKWFEKQNEVDTVSYEVAENEKREFVGYGFLKCKGDFLSFKEGENYWLEYVGKDNYNVRSDNLLGQTFHIKPMELYTVFRPLLWTEKQGEQKPAELPKGEDYGIDGLYAAVDILQKTLGEVDGYQTDDGILEHKCAISAVKELSKQKLAWSEEDENMLGKLLDYCNLSIAYNGKGTLQANVWEQRKEWLKSLRPQNTWKPSDEQMEALDSAIHCYAGISPTNNREVYTLEIMKEQLNKLREE